MSWARVKASALPLRSTVCRVLVRRQLVAASKRKRRLILSLLQIMSFKIGVATSICLPPMGLVHVDCDSCASSIP